MPTIQLRTYTKNDSRIFNRCELQRILGISNRGVWRKYLICSGHDPDDSKARYTWDDVPLLVAVKLFLGAKKGRHKHTYLDFLELRENDQLSDELLNKAKQITEELQYDYENSISSAA